MSQKALRSFRKTNHTPASLGPALKPSVEIIEEPAEEFRFRYEERVKSSIPGANSGLKNTYPTIRVNNYEGPVKIIVSCVDMDEPYRPHPHKLVGGSKHGDSGALIYETKITKGNPTVQFKNVAIQCTTRDQFKESLRQRATMSVDPFRTGYDSHPYSLHYVRLAFQVFLPDAVGNCCIPLRSIATRIITDYKRLTIKEVSHANGIATGNTKIMMFTERLPSKDVEVVFFEKATGWKALATIQNQHKMCGLVITTPPFRDPAITKPVQVSYYLSRPLPKNEDALERHCQSDLQPFEYTPVPCSTAKHKRPLLLVMQGDPVPPKTKIEPSSPQINQASAAYRESLQFFDEEKQQHLRPIVAGSSNPNWQQSSHPVLPCPSMAQGPSHLPRTHQLFASASTPLEMQALAFKEMASQTGHGLNHLFMGENSPLDHLVLSRAPMEQVFPMPTHHSMGHSYVLGEEMGYDPTGQPSSILKEDICRRPSHLQMDYDPPNSNHPPIDHSLGLGLWTQEPEVDGGVMDKDLLESLQDKLKCYQRMKQYEMELESQSQCQLLDENTVLPSFHETLNQP